MALTSWDVLLEPSAESRQEAVSRNRLHSQRYGAIGEFPGEPIDEEDNLMTLVFKSLESLDSLQVLGLADILEASIARRLQRLWSALTSNRAEQLVERLESMSTEQRRLLLGRVALEQVASIAESVDLVTRRDLAKRRGNASQASDCSVCGVREELLGEDPVRSVSYRPRSHSSPEPLRDLPGKLDGQERSMEPAQQRHPDTSKILLTNLCLDRKRDFTTPKHCNEEATFVREIRGDAQIHAACPEDDRSGAPSHEGDSNGNRANGGKLSASQCISCGIDHEHNNNNESSRPGLSRCHASEGDLESTAHGSVSCRVSDPARGARRTGKCPRCRAAVDDCGQGLVLRDAMGRCLSSEDLGRGQSGSQRQHVDLVRDGREVGGRADCGGAVAGADAGNGLEQPSTGEVLRGAGGGEDLEDADAAFMLLLLTENKEKHSDRQLVLRMEYIEGFYGFPVETVGVHLDGDGAEEDERGEALRTEGWQERLQEGLMQNLLHLGLNVSGLVGPGSNLPASIRHYVDTIGCFQRLVRALKANEAVPRTGAPPAAVAVITRLPSVVVSAAHIAEGAGQCSICRERLRVSTCAMQVPCGHLFHADCILPWLRRRNSCPVCRYELPTDDLDYELLRQRRRQRAMQDRDMPF